MQRSALSLALFAFLSHCSPSGNNDASVSNADASMVATEGGTISCGSATCGANQYCEDLCVCCGGPVGGGRTPSRMQTCRTLPTQCSLSNLCNCTAIDAGVCNQTARTVEIPCPP